MLIYGCDILWSDILYLHGEVVFVMYLMYIYFVFSAHSLNGDRTKLNK